MNALLEKHLVKTYPKLFRDMYGDPKKTCMAWGCSCGDGWFFLLNTLCDAIQYHIDQAAKWKKLGVEQDEVPQVVFHQIKEKFGALRIYYEGGDDYIRNAISFAEYQSHYICENCGQFDQFVGRTDKGWIQSLCIFCADEYKKNIKTDKKMITLMEKVKQSRKNPKRAWKGIDEPLTPSDLIPPYEKNKKTSTKKRKK